MKFLFLMDPLNTVDVYKDTSFIFMVGAHRRGHEVFYLPTGGITLRGQRVLFDVVAVIPQVDESQPFLQKPATVLDDTQVDAVFIRTDPPFNESYLMNTWLLDRLPRHVLVLNSPGGLRTVNEKLWVTQFTDFIPPTLVTSRHEYYDAFVSEHGKVVVKPTDAKGGEGVFIVRADDSNGPVVFQTLTHNFTREVIVQKYIPAATEGDKRILLLEGEPLGAVLRLHGDKDHRNNFFAGGKPYPADINERDMQIIEVIKPHLKELGLVFTGIDIIGDYLIEVNVTSPTCVQEINRINGTQLEDRIIAHVEQLIESKQVIA